MATVAGQEPTPEEENTFQSSQSIPTVAVEYYVMLCSAVQCRVMACTVDKIEGRDDTVYEQ